MFQLISNDMIKLINYRAFVFGSKIHNMFAALTLSLLHRTDRESLSSELLKAKWVSLHHWASWGK